MLQRLRISTRSYETGLWTGVSRVGSRGGGGHWNVSNIPHIKKRGLSCNGEVSAGSGGAKKQSCERVVENAPSLPNSQASNKNINLVPDLQTSNSANSTQNTHNVSAASNPVGGNLGGPTTTYTASSKPIETPTHTQLKQAGSKTETSTSSNSNGSIRNEDTITYWSTAAGGGRQSKPATLSFTKSESMKVPKFSVMTNALKYTEAVKSKVSNVSNNVVHGLRSFQSELKAHSDNDAHWTENIAGWTKVISTRLNSLTGYDMIMRLKEGVEHSDAAHVAARKAYKEAQASLAQIVKDRRATQQDINVLLQKQQYWHSEEVAKFGELHRSEHSLKRAEESAEKCLERCEQEVESSLRRYTLAIRERYHEEQLWSDKIRSISTYGTLIVMGFNFLIVFFSLVAFEPMKRRRIIAGVKESLEDALTQERHFIHQEVQAAVKALHKNDFKTGFPSVNATGAGTVATHVFQEIPTSNLGNDHTVDLGLPHLNDERSVYKFTETVADTSSPPLRDLESTHPSAPMIIDDSPTLTPTVSDTTILPTSTVVYGVSLPTPTTTVSPPTPTPMVINDKYTPPSKVVDTVPSSVPTDVHINSSAQDYMSWLSSVGDKISSGISERDRNIGVGVFLLSSGVVVLLQSLFT
eukprot:CFRG0286T1